LSLWQSLRFPSPLIEPDVPISGIRLSDWIHRMSSGIGCAPWKGGVFQWVQVPPGDRSSRKQPEQLWRWRNSWSLRNACHELV